MNIQKLIQAMTLEEKIELCSGKDFWETKANERLKIPSFVMSDGPHGIRYQSNKGDNLGINDSEPATCFPTAVTSGNTWDMELLVEEGRAIGAEAKQIGVDVVLGPGLNIKRNPLCGRNFEYFSEDPYLSGRLAASYVSGMQDAGVSSCLKHFAANSQEYKRFNGNSQVDERALREIYLAGFEYAVKEAKPDSVMCAYPAINGVYCSDNKRLLTDILRNEWGFDGFVVTDWGAMNDRTNGFVAGCDLVMPGGSAYGEEKVKKAVRKGKLDEKAIDKCVERILRQIEKVQEQSGVKIPANYAENDALACKIAEQGAVLLKNENEILPLRENNLVLIGHMAKEIRYQGAGSSHINPHSLTNVCEMFPNATYVESCDAEGTLLENGLTEAVNAARKADKVVIFAGLPASYESEGFDRTNLNIPQGQIDLIKAVTEANANTIVVLMGGGVIDVSWADNVKGLLYMGLPGQAGGRAIHNLLTGKAIPCGKLAETWPISYQDVVSKDTFGQKAVEYRESIYVGYRYYDKANKKVRFPFGYGLSYTKFQYSDLNVTDKTVTVKIKNAGDYKGAEIVQFYISAPQTGIHRPLKELKGFAKVWLDPNETKTVSFVLDDRSYSVWNNGWKKYAGEYRIMVGASSEDIRLFTEITVDGIPQEKLSWQQGSWYETMRGTPSAEEWYAVMGGKPSETPPLKKGYFTLNNSITEMKDYSSVMRKMYNQVYKTIVDSFGGTVDETNAQLRMTLESSVGSSMRNMVICGGGGLAENTAEGLVALANGRFFKAIRLLLKKKK